VREANRACLNRLAVNIDSSDMLARDVRKRITPPPVT
jgi:hypothetical protein